METNHIFVNGDREKTMQALDEADRFTEYQNYEKKSALRVRLLGEEMFGILYGIAGDYEGFFWVEGEGLSCKLYLEATIAMNPEKKRELISVSSDGKNASSKGIASKIRDMIERGMDSFDESAKMAADAGTPVAFYSLGMEPSVATLSVVDWSLARYKGELESLKEEESEAIEAWDELEKSIIANLADDVHVGVRENKVTITVEKDFRK